jgi:hypothetical protein
MSERRKTPRNRVLKGARLLLGNRAVMDCVVRNISGTGAGIDIPNALGMPDRVNMALDDKASTRRCRSVWRKLCKIGVEFN